MAKNKSFALGKSRKYYLVVGTVILGIAVAHFGMQMIFIQKENLRSFEAAVETVDVPFSNVETDLPVEQTLEVSPEKLNAEKAGKIVVPEAKAVPVRKKEIVVPEPKPARKKEVKEVRETRAERLRRAERFLTGV